MLCVGVMGLDNVDFLVSQLDSYRERVAMTPPPSKTSRPRPGRYKGDQRVRGRPQGGKPGGNGGPVVGKGPPEGKGPGALTVDISVQDLRKFIQLLNSG